jgi:lambda family phage portal protein
MNKTLIDINGAPLSNSMNGFHGAGDSFGKQLASWQTSPMSANAALLPDFESGNARSEDLVRNDGYAKTGVQLHIDHIVGHQWKLVYKPNYRLLGLDRAELDEFVKLVEAKFTDFAEDKRCFIDAERRRTFTMMIREAVGTHCKVGEITAKAEFFKKQGTKYNTCLNMINYARIANPNNRMDSSKIKAGVQLDKHGAAIGYHVRKSHPSDDNPYNSQWTYVKRRLTWGREQLIHIFDPTGDGEVRGTNNLFASLSKLKMLEKFQATTLQNAIVNAMYAAVIESDLNSEDVFRAIGGGGGTDDSNMLLKFMETKAEYHEASGIALNGVKLPHLLPSEKFSLNSVNAPSASLGEFEAGILRGIAKSLGVSFEQLSGDFSKTNYSSARAAMGESFKYFMGKRETIAKRFAGMIFELWFEEALQLGEIVLPTGAIGGFYDYKSAWTRCNWIGAGKVEIDGLKGVKESIEKIKAGLSTYEIELGNQGLDYQEVFDQQAREAVELGKVGRTPIWMRDEPQENDDDDDDEKKPVNENPEVHTNE